ncbi:hypothetical protein AB0J52_13380 [Spirillospora sp. NPDC049652]
MGICGNRTANGGDLAGYYVPEDSEAGHGIIVRAGKITSFDAPGAAGTTAFDTNDHDQVVGTGFPEQEARKALHGPTTIRAILRTANP